jgi:hypothetical protein
MSLDINLVVIAGLDESTSEKFPDIVKGMHEALHGLASSAC